MATEFLKNNVNVSGSFTVYDILSSQTNLSQIFATKQDVEPAVQTISQLSAKWESTYSTTTQSSATWNDTFAKVSTLSSTWEESAEIIPTVTNYLSTSFVDLSSINVTGQLLSSGNDLYSIFLTSETDSQTLSFNEETKDLSISNGNTISLTAFETGIDVEVRSLTADYTSVYNTVQTNSAVNWDNTLSNQYVHLNFLPLSGGTLTGTFIGDVSATGSFYGDGSKLTGIVAGDVVATTLVRTNSGYWEGTYTVVQANSAVWSSAIMYSKNFDYIADGIDYSYSGMAPAGTLNSDALWKITRLIFTDTGSLSSSGIAQNVTWNERLTAIYT